MRKQEYNEKVDNYAFGVILWEICTRRYFLDADSNKWLSQIEDAVLSGERPHIPSLVPAVCLAFFCACFSLHVCACLRLR